jgi:PTS system ascorbate-specific IIA component
MSVLDNLTTQAVAVGYEAKDWQSAIRAAGDLLVKTGVTTDAYTQKMIDAVLEHGPYIVIAPGLALAHTRPDESVLGTGLSVVTLREPVNFGSPENDPVSIIIGFAARDANAHIEALSLIADALSDTDNINDLVKATSPSRVIELIIRDKEA